MALAGTRATSHSVGYRSPEACAQAVIRSLRGLERAMPRAIKRVGVAGIRTVGRGAFPQLTYSCDGLLPLDLIARRQRGHFAALEFDAPWTQIYETSGLIGHAMKAGAREP